MLLCRIFLLLLFSEFISTTTLQPYTSHVTCDIPKLQHGDWFCPPSSSPPTCHLECHPGYVSTNSTVITCEDGQWTEQPLCVTALAIITGGLGGAYRSVEVYGDNLYKQLPNLPDVRYSHSLQLVNSVLLLCGGYPYSSSTKTSCLSFTSSQQWTSHSTTKYSRHSHSSVSMLGHLHLLGGFGSKSTTEQLIPPSNQWTSGWNLLEETRDACAAKISPEEFVMTGGQYYPNSVVKYNVTSGASTRLQNLITGTYTHGCVFVRDLDNGFRGVLVAGGTERHHSESEMYDINAGEWASTGPLTQGKQWFRLVVLGEKILALGGRNSRGDFLTSVDQFNMTSKKWITGDEMLVGRGDFALAPVPLSVVTTNKN